MRVNSSNFKQGDLVIARLIFSEQVGSKIRPALVISNSEFNLGSDDLVLLKIGSKGGKTRYDVPLTSKDLDEGRLKTESQIMVDNPVTTYKKLIESKIGKVSNQKLQEVKKKIKELYGL